MKYIAAALCALTSPALACGDAETPCEIDQGSYHINTPDNAEGPVPAVLFLHGAGGKGTGILRMGGPMLERGYAVIGPNGMDRPGRFGTGWSFHPDRPQQRDEIEFIRAVIDDAVENHGIDRDRILLGGFSIGGSMASYLACDAPDVARAYAPVAGSFWRPHPAMDSCEGPVDLLHTHGWRDKTVPLEGRPLRNGVIHQGDVFQGMQIWRETNNCAGMRADTFETSGDFWRRKWETCENGSLEFVLHQGAHGIPKGWSTMAMDWFESLE
ncbi:MAG: alpha/beta fold hydrolase [Litoreibacter sp.]|uniref:alpha/beta hydrolase family esterase n=1 Tax=Litoreibacter sp. TaxID=1969459 RepID=UPI00329880FF